MPDGATVKTSKAAVGFQYCNKLFSLEKKCANLKDKYRKEYRQNIMLPVLEEYFCWVNTLDPEKGSKLEYIPLRHGEAESLLETTDQLRLYGQLSIPPTLILQPDRALGNMPV